MTETAPASGLTPDLIDLVTKLSEPDKQRLFDILLFGPEDPPDVVKAEWAGEIARRLDDIRSGRVQLLDAKQALAAIRQRLREKHGV